MLLDARNNLFQFSFPRNFIPKEISDKYKPYLNRMPGNVIEEPIDFINYTIQSINLPGMGFEPVTQAQYPGRNIVWRNTLPTQELFQKEFTVTFQLVDGYINYWILLDTLNYYYRFSNGQKFIEDLNVRMTDSEGNILVTARIKRPLIKNIGDLSMSFASNVAEFSTFELSIGYNELEVIIELD
jgi:hypothetical protein